MLELSDNEILEVFNAKESKEKGFNLLVRKYQERVYWHIRRIVVGHEDTNDIIQNVFVKIWKNLESFRGDSKLYSWIYRIATNEALTFLKQKKKRFFFNIDIENNLAKTLEEDFHKFREHLSGM